MNKKEEFINRKQPIKPRKAEKKLKKPNCEKN
jgi:hypothetical protein